MHAAQARAEIVGIKVDEGSLVVWARGLTMFWALVPVNSTPKKLCEGNYLDEDNVVERQPLELQNWVKPKQSTMGTS